MRVVSRVYKQQGNLRALSALNHTRATLADVQFGSTTTRATKPFTRLLIH